MTDHRAITNDPVAFRSALKIDSDGGPRPLSDCIDDWQSADFAALDGGWRRVAGFDCEGLQRAWLERPRGHSKTSDLAAMVVWVLLAGRRQLSGIAAAADRDQARLLRDAISRLVSLNAWLAPVIDVQSYRIANRRTGSTLDILSSDVGSSYGLTPDFVIIDEVTHWPRRELFDSLLSAAAKRSHCMLVSISNAGVTDSWQYALREAVRIDPSWYFSRQEGPVASWINAAILAEQKRLLPGIAYRRLWLNEWTSGAGDAVDPTDLAAAITADGPLDGFDLRYAPFIGSLDVGVTSDHSAFTIIGAAVNQPRMRFAKSWFWDPRQYGGRVPLHLVKQTIADAHQQYSSAEHGCQLCVVFDPHQGQYLAQQLADENVPMFIYPWTAPAKQQMALTLVECFRERLISLHDDQRLTSDLSRISIIERMGKYSITAPRDERGHCDVGMAFCQNLVWARDTRIDIQERLGIIPASSPDFDSNGLLSVSR